MKEGAPNGGRLLSPDLGLFILRLCVRAGAGCGKNRDAPDIRGSSSPVAEVVHAANPGEGVSLWMKVTEIREGCGGGGPKIKVPAGFRR